MKSTIGFALASGLLLIAGCATRGAGGGTMGAAGGGGPVASAGDIRNFNLVVKCPGVHQMKTHHKTDADIMEQLQVDQDEIARCEAWEAAQPKGYVPPPPPGVASSQGQPSAPGGAPSRTQ